MTIEACQATVRWRYESAQHNIQHYRSIPLTRRHRPASNAHEYKEKTMQRNSKRVDDSIGTNREEGAQACHVRSALKKSMHQRVASLTEVEKVFLSSLLIDRPDTIQEEEDQKRKIKRATKVLDDDILFCSLPPKEVDGNSIEGADAEEKPTAPEQIEASRPLPPKPTRSNEAQLDLWKAHQDGVKPVILKEKGKTLIAKKSSIMQSPSSDSKIDGKLLERQSSQQRRRRSSKGLKKQLKSSPERLDCDHVNTIDGFAQKQSTDEDENDANSTDVLSDQEVGSINDESTASSWNSSQGGFDHYNAWEVLRDEYAEDFGFKVAVDDENINVAGVRYWEQDEDQRGLFKILGTSHDDISALPHVLSPPIMDSLLNFVPETLADENFWLKFSLVRDGASLDILKRYCRAATHTVLAIETTNGEVFGAFTSSPWRTNNQYFGTGEAFLWRMRHSRNTPVHSLFEQAQLESEIDIFPYNGSNDYIQLCTHDKLALGGGSTALKKDNSIKEGEPFELVEDMPPVVFLEDTIYGFGLALDENLLHGTTSPCATFGNSNLINGSGSGETFDVMNLEVWGFTSAETIESAERSEMSVFFVRESLSNLSSSHTSASSIFSGEDLSRDRFYRRVGQDDENESDREAWQYANMMNPVAGSPYGNMGSSYGR